MSDFKHCEFRHLMVRARALGVTYWTHVHEDEALSCAALAGDGWPDPRLTS